MTKSSSDTSMEARRTEGNALFTAKEFNAAIAKYTEGLALASASTDDTSQRVLLLSNRAACHLQLNQFEEAVKDCAQALEIDPGNEKARYRRAQASMALGNLSRAFQDVRLVLQVNPHNKAAIIMARKLKDLVQQDVHGLQKALDSILQAIDDPHSIASQQERLEETLKFLEAKCHAELSSVPSELETKGGVTVLWRFVMTLFHQLESDGSSKCIVLSVLTHVIAVVSIVASASLPLAAIVYAQSQTEQALDRLLGLLHDQIALDYANAIKNDDQMPSFGLKSLIKLMAFLFKHLMLHTDDDAAIRRVLNGLFDGLRSHDVQLQLAALDGILHFISTPVQIDENHDKTTEFQLKKTRFATIAHELGVFSLFHATATAAIAAKAAQDDYEVLLSRLPLVFTQCLAPLEANESLLKKLVRDYCVSPVLVVSNDQLNTATASCLLLSSLYLSNSKLALWAVQQTANDGTAFLSRIHSFLLHSRTLSDPTVRQLQAIWVDCVASVCGVDGGTSCVPPALRIEIFKLLQANLDDQDLVLKASALSIHVKLAVVEKSLDLETVEGQVLLTTVFDVLEHAHEYEIQRKSQDRHLFWSGASPKERAIEALSYLITLTPVKEALVRRPPAITSVFQIEFPSISLHHTGYRSNVYYGIAYILHHTLTSESKLKKKQMEGMDMTPEQYEELQKALKQKSALDDGDADDNVQERVKKLMASRDVVGTLVHLLKSTTSHNVVEMAVLSALDAAEVASVRGKLVQSGVFQALIPLSLPSKDKKQKQTKMSNAAAQAMAKILISTNPSLLQSSSLLSSIKPLLEVCKGDTQLLQFEALMALTNIASLSDETKARIVAEPHGLSTLQYLQFSEHELVRRAATETICNLLPNEVVIEKIFMNEEKLRLWLAFASVEEEQEDFETARAAAGALAMVSQVPQVAWLMMKNNAIQTFARDLEISTKEETLHRALFAMENMLLALEEEQNDEKKQEKEELLTQWKQHKTMMIKKIKEIVQKYGGPTQEAAQSCLAVVAKVISG